MRGFKTTPPSRQGKKQVIAFLWPNQAEAAYAKAARDDKTNQEVIGEALNAAFACHGLPPPVPAGHRRIVRRNSARAGVRDGCRDPLCRTGRVSFGGWFNEDVVSKVQALASQNGIPVQALVELGLKLITGVPPTQDGREPPAAGERADGTDGIPA